MRWFILADDLTGAADCAARCKQAGLAATILLPAAPMPDAGARGAICLTSDSRHLDAAQAARKMHALASSLCDTGAASWYKKIDSTLRGHIGQELDALLDALGQPCALICPAFPAQRRGLKDGYLQIDPGPAQSAHLPSLLAQQSRRQVAAVGLADLRAGRLAPQLLQARARGAELLVVDALSEEDVQAVAETALRCLPEALLCGSAGLAGALATRYAAQSPPSSPWPDAAPEPIEQPALLVVGSGSAMAQRQIAYMRHHITTIEAGLPLPADRSGDILLHLPAPPSGMALDGPHARALAERLADAARALLGEGRLLLLAGGDTAISTLAHMGVHDLVVVRELLPGIPLTLGRDAAGQAHPIILKAGNHGDEAALATLLARARRVS